MGIQDWSITPANNTDTPPNGAPENLAAKDIASVFRQQMADHRAQWNDAEWFQFGDGDGAATIAYVSGTQFSVAGGDFTTHYHVGRRVRAFGSSTGTIFGTITGSSFSANTVVTVTWDSGALQNEALTIWTSIINAVGGGMPTVFNEAGADVDFRFEGTAEPNLLFTDAGNNRVGVGTATPDSRLHVHAGSAGSVSATSGSVITSESSGDTHVLQMLSPNTATQSLAFGDADSATVGGISYAHPTDTLALKTGATERLALSGSATVFNETGADVDFRVEGDTEANLLYVDAGNERIGLGIAAPDSRLHVHAGSAGSVSASSGSVLTVENSGTGYVQMLTPSSASAGVLFGDPDDTDVGSIVYDHSSNYLATTVNGGEMMRVTANGRVLVGTTSEVGLTAPGLNVVTGGIRSAGYFANTDTTDTSSNLAVATANSGPGSASVQSTSSHTSYAYSMYFVECGRASNSAYNFARYRTNGNEVFILRGDGNAFADGSWSGSGADYQEFFESTNGSALVVGSTVVLDGDTVRAFNAQKDKPENIIGVVRPKEDSKNSMIVGNTAWNHWTEKYLTDDFGVYLREDATTKNWTEKTADGGQKAHSYYVAPAWLANVPEGVTVPKDAETTTQSVRKQNPDFDPAAPYTAREGRPEWNLIGLLGQIQILKSATKRPGWVKMKDISATVELWLVR